MASLQPNRVGIHPAVVSLENELYRRIQKNPRYSLRAFARSLGMSHALLSLLFAGKRKLSKKSAARLLETMPMDSAIFSELVAFGRADKKSPPSDEDLSAQYDQISLDTFALLSDWYHYAILSLLELSSAKMSARWIAGRLGISETEARLAVARLMRLGLISKKGGRWKQTGQALKVENTESTAATRKHHAQLLQKAAEALENHPFAVRDFSSITFAMDPVLVPYARAEIRKFRRRLVKNLESRGKASEVYHLSVQIYPVTAKEKRYEKSR